MNGEYKVEMVDAGLVVPSPYQTRKHFDFQELQGLAQNIVEGGLLHPIVVRMVDGGVPELIAGERRLRAWRLRPEDLGEVIPARVIDVDDTTAAEMVVSENMQRADLLPLEEAAGIAALLSTGKSKDEVAAVLGRSRSWVVRRANLCNLSEVVKAGLDDEGSKFFGMDLCCLEAIAKYPAEVQDKAVKDYSHCFDSLCQIEKAFGWVLQDLDDACFDVSECGGCTSRTGAESDLFDHVEGLGQCLQPACFDGKVRAHYQALVDGVAADHPGMLIFSNDRDFLKCDGVRDYWKDKEYGCGWRVEGNPEAFDAVLVDACGHSGDKFECKITKTALKVQEKSESAPARESAEDRAAREAKEDEIRKRNERVAAFAIKRLKADPFDCEAFIERVGIEQFVSFLVSVFSKGRYPSESDIKKQWKEVRKEGRVWVKSVNKDINERLKWRLDGSGRYFEALGQAAVLFGDTEKGFLSAVFPADKGKGKGKKATKKVAVKKAKG